MSTQAPVDRGPRPLVERDEELAAIDRLLDGANGGSGGLLLVEGPAGIGKTSLLAEARRRASGRGMTVLAGVGTEFEREYPFGVVRQALGPLVREESDRERLLVGAAHLAEHGLFDTEREVDAAPFGLLNGLYWLVANVSDEAPVLLVADDAHWADDPSLRFLGFLARRLDSLGVALLVGARTAADFSTAPALAEIRDQARAAGVRVEPQTLDRSGVAQLLAQGGADGPVDNAFVVACHDATGGNPFLLDELLRALARARTGFSAADAERVGGLSVPGVVRSTAQTLDRLGADARALARAAAVLGEGASVELAAELAGVEPGAATQAARALTGAGLLEWGRDLRFRHPILAGAVRDGISPHDLADSHSHAAQLLRTRGAPPERVALQLLHVPPAQDLGVVEELREAGRRASARGAPGAAGMLLRRALAEPPAVADHAEVLIELGRAELDVGRPSSATNLFIEANDRAEDPLVRGRAASMVARIIPGDPTTTARLAELVRAAHEEVAPLDRELGLRLRAILALNGESPEDLALEGETLAEGAYLGAIVFPRMTPTARADDLADIARRGARQADALLEEGAIGLAFTGIVLALRWTENFAEAEALLVRAIETARRRGSTVDFAVAMTLRANVHRGAGRLRDAEADARSALPATLDDHWQFARGIQPLVLSLLDQGRVGEAAETLASVVDESDSVPDAPPMIPVLLARMAIHAARREPDRALVDWQDAIARSRRTGGLNAGWIEDFAVAADAYAAIGDREAARATAGQAVEIATTWGRPGAIGQALHAQARVGKAEDREATLAAAVDHLSRSPMRLAHAKALIAYGATIRRAGRRSESREPLREGHELALGCAADGLADVARTELRASGVRVRREPRTGADELTPSERRIADMAAEGLSNAEIAQELFLTVKTVEMHLTQSYRKLGINGRRELARTLKSQV